MYNTDYARQFNRKIKAGTSFSVRNPLTGQYRGVTKFKAEKGYLMCRSEMSGKWLHTRFEDVHEEIPAP